MAKPDWGTKRVCLNCGARFYDLNRDSIVCPACGTPYDAAAHTRPRRSRSARMAPVAVEATDHALAAEAENEEEGEVTVESEDEGAGADDEAEEDDEEEADSAIEDVSELADDDMTDVIDTDMDEDEGER